MGHLEHTSSITFHVNRRHLLIKLSLLLDFLLQDGQMPTVFGLGSLSLPL